MKILMTLLNGTALTLFLSMACSVYAQDIVVSEKDFTCIRDGHKIRNTFIRHSDPAETERSDANFSKTAFRTRSIRSGPSCSSYRLRRW